MEDYELDNYNQDIMISNVLRHSASEGFVKIWKQIACDDDAGSLLFPLCNYYYEDFLQELKIQPFIQNTTTLIEEALKDLYEKLLVSIEEALKEYKDGCDKEFYDITHEIESFYQKYEHLFTNCMAMVERHYRYICEIVDDTVNNRKALYLHGLISKEDALITKIKTGMGSRHQNGRTVSTLYFSDQSKIVYKPRNIEIEIGFERLLSWVNKNLPENRRLFQTKHLDCASYGYSQYIAREECKNEEDVKSYYYRTGILSAILYMLEANGIQPGHMVKCKGHPVMIDLEALFQNLLTIPNKEDEREKADYKAQQILSSSVYNTNHFPLKLFHSKEINGMLKKNGYTLIAYYNIPHIHGKERLPEDYAAYFIEGFQYVYHLVLNAKDEAKSVIRENFGQCSCRIILRPDHFYLQFMKFSYHCHLFQSSAQRFTLMKCEIEDILNGDIPYFICLVKDTQIKDSKGKKVNLSLPFTPLEHVINKIEHFSKEDLQLQKSLIFGKFIAKDMKRDSSFWQTQNVFILSDKTQHYLNTARKIGDIMMERSTKGRVGERQEKSYINFMPVEIDQPDYEFAVVGSDLYGGNSGISLFLSNLYQISGNIRFLKGSRETIGPLLNEIEKNDFKSFYQVGAYNGLSGHLYSISKLYQITKDNSLIPILLNGCKKVESLIENDKTYDIISGGSGVILVMASIVHQIKDLDIIRKAYSIIEKTSKYLIRKAITIEDDKVCWENKAAGYAHGVGGICVALYQAHTMVGISGIDDIIEKIMNYERHLLKEENQFVQNRFRIGESLFGWCHGVPGALLERIRLLELGYEYSDMEKEIENFIQLTKQHGFGNNISYCHGDIGNLEILERAGSWLREKELLDSCELTYQKISANIISYIQSNPMLPLGIMHGVAGIGYSALRKGSLKVPSILLLE